MDWTWDEIIIAAEVTTSYHAHLMTTYFRTIASAFGVELKGDVSTGGSKKTEEAKAIEAAEDIAALAAMGLVKVGGKQATVEEALASLGVDSPGQATEGDSG